jgi:uncharacterized membrane protein YkvA (DUF1232 family)
MREQEKFSELELLEKVKKESSVISSKDVDLLLSKEKQLEKKTGNINLKIFLKLIRQIKIAFQIIKEYKNRTYTDIPWKTIGLLVVAIIYFFNPFDILPDTIPVLGFTDDTAVVAVVFTALRKDILKYCSWKGISAEGLF